MKVFSGLLLFLVFGFQTAVFAQDFTDAHEKIRRAAENRDYSAAVSRLQSLQKQDKKIFELNNYDYLLARMAEKQGDFALAAANYQSVAARDSVLKEYALWHLAHIARSSGNLMLERLFLQEIQAAAPQSLLNEAVNARLARSYFESKNFDSAIRLLAGNAATKSQSAKTEDRRPKTEDRINNRLFRENLVLLGESYLQTGKREEARTIFIRLTSELPNIAQPDDFALAGARGLDILDGKAEDSGKTAPQLAEAEHLRRAGIYQFNRDFAGARLHYRAIVERFPSSQILPDVLYQIGRGFALEDNVDQAIKWFERVQTEFPDHPTAPDALSQEASAYARLGKTKEAVSRYRKIIEKYPDHARLDRAYLNIVDALRDAGEDAEALQWTEKTQENFVGKLPEAIALFAQARIRIANNEWSNALIDLEKLLTFSDLGGTRVPSGTNKAEITFLRALTLEKLQKFPEAVDAYLSISDGRGEYYGWRATERLRNLGVNEKTKSIIAARAERIQKSIAGSPNEEYRKKAVDYYRLTNDLKILHPIKGFYAGSSEYQKTPNFQLPELGRKEVLREKRQESLPNSHKNIADELLFLGLYDEAAPELEISLAENAAKDQKSKTENLNYALAVLYRRGETAHRAVVFIEPLWRKVPADYLIELMPREQAELLYPAPYTDALLQSAPPRSVDPRFVLAIMRQESRFRADVKSVAAARGLMQFISSTSNQIAKQLGKENFRQDDLYHPPTAVLFGTEYLANLFKLFPGQPPAVAASYNGGETNMARWLARAKSDDPDRYVAEIVYSQTKDYVYKVMANYRVYQMLYDEKLKIARE